MGFIEGERRKLRGRKRRIELEGKSLEAIPNNAKVKIKRIIFSLKKGPSASKSELSKIFP